MFEHVSSPSRRSSDPDPACASGAGASTAGGCATNGRAETVPPQGLVCTSLATWPRLCHDLRTPLNAILGNAELLLDGSAGPLSREARACLGDIQTAAGRMMRHVQALLELCRARSAPILATDGRVDLLALLEAVEALRHVDAAVRIAPAGARFVVRGDSAWLQLLANVLAELYLGDGRVRGPLEVTVEGAARWGILRLWWADLQPDQVPALPLALTDAILDLHDGKLSLTPCGVLLHWPDSRLAQVEFAAGARPVGDESG